MKIYAHYVEPERYPAFNERGCTAVTHDALDNKVQFSSSRFFMIDPETNKLINIDEDIKRYTEDYKIGNCFWLHWKTITADNFEELVDKLQEKNLFLYGFWGFVPGTKSDHKNAIHWGEFEIPEERDKYMNEKLGAHFFGYEMGEQDGRYIGAYTAREDNTSRPKNRLAQCKAFSDFFARIAENFYGKMTILSSLTMLHYYARDGYSSLLNCEAAQGLLNSQMWYGFIRGASKQYGLLCAGNVSVWNPWGYKTYESVGQYQSGKKWGPEHGTSLSLMRRILYTEYMYNCDFLGFEQGWFSDDNTENRLLNQPSNDSNVAEFGLLSPIGTVQESANKLIEKIGKPGVMYTPVALIMDAFAGWLPPRYMYTSLVYHSWGNIPYNSGDYQTHLIFSQLYPGYEDSSYYRDETGYLTSSPYGEILDVLLSDVDTKVLNRYQMALVANDTQMNYEMFDKLKKFVTAGGHAVIFADTVKKYADEISKYDDAYNFFGIKYFTGKTNANGNAAYKGKTYKVNDLSLYTAELGDVTTIAQIDDNALIYDRNYGKGTITVIMAENGLEVKDREVTKENVRGSGISQPFAFSSVISEYLADCYNAFALVKTNNDELEYIVTVKENGALRLMVVNNSHTAQKYDIIGCAGKITSVTQIPTDDGTKAMKGYSPDDLGYDNSVCKGTGEHYLEVGDLALYDIEIDAEFDMMDELYPEKCGVNTAVRMCENAVTAKDFVMENPSVRNYFDTLLVGAEYIERMDIEYIKKEASFLHRIGINISVDFTLLLNHYPDLCFSYAFPERREESYNRINSIIEKIKYYDCESVLVSLIRLPESRTTSEEHKKALAELYAYLVSALKENNVKVIYQNRPIAVGLDEGFKLAETVEGLGLAYNTSGAKGADFAAVNAAHKIESLVLSAPVIDAFGQVYNALAPVASVEYGNQIKDAVNLLEKDENTTLYFAADYSNWDEIYNDYKFIFGK